MRTLMRVRVSSTLRMWRKLQKCLEVSNIFIIFAVENKYWDICYWSGRCAFQACDTGSNPVPSTRLRSLTIWKFMELWQTWCMRWTENPEKVVQLHPAPPKLSKVKPWLPGCAGTGRQARLRIWCRKAWGFESLHPDCCKKTLSLVGVSLLPWDIMVLTS